MAVRVIRQCRYLWMACLLLSAAIVGLMSRQLREELALGYGSGRGEAPGRGAQGGKTNGGNESELYPLEHLSAVYRQLTEDFRPDGSDKLDHLCRISSGGSDRKNVLFIMSDDLRPQLGSYWGRHYPNPYTDLRPRTPHLDRLARSSLLLTRAYVQYPLCGPSRASLLTGRRPDAISTWRLETNFREVHRDATTLPEYFKSHGYISVNIGKIFHQGHGWTNDYQSWNIPNPRDRNPYQELYLSRMISPHTVAGMVTPEDRQGNMITPDESSTRNSVNYLRQLASCFKSKKTNFFLAVGYHRPHLPWLCSEEFFDLHPLETVDVPREENKYYPRNFPMDEHEPHLELLKHVLNTTRHAPNEILADNETKYYRRAYFGCVSFVDDMVGILLDEVQRLGLANSTIVAFLGDHGWHLGENGLWGKRTAFEQSNHAPLMVKIPGATDDGVVSDSLVEFIDVFPTLVEAAGLPPVPSCPRHSEDVLLCTDGASFLPLATNPNAELKPAAVSQVLTNRKMGYSIKTNRYRYTEWVPLNRTEVGETIYDYHLQWDKVVNLELYDHEEDPEENVNLAYEASHRHVVSSHSRVLKDIVPGTISQVRIDLFN